MLLALYGIYCTGMTGICESGGGLLRTLACERVVE